MRPHNICFPFVFCIKYTLFTTSYENNYNIMVMVIAEFAMLSWAGHIKENRKLSSPGPSPKFKEGKVILDFGPSLIFVGQITKS